MKQAFYLLVLIFLGISISSCKNDEENGGAGASSIIITTNKLIFEQGETITTFVVTNESVNVTDDAEITLGDEVISKTHQLNIVGEFVLSATYNNLTSNELEIVVVPPPHIVSLSISTDCENRIIDEEFVFYAEATYSDDSVTDMTEDVVFKINGNIIDNNVFSSSSSGDFIVTANIDDVSSNELNINVDSIGSRFQKYAIIEDYTGTWCGWCPRIAYGIELVEDATNFAIPIAVHSGDSMANTFGSSLESSFSITGYPTAYLDRAATWNYPEPNNVNQVLDYTTTSSRVGLSLEASLSGSTINLDVMVKFGENFCNNDLYLTVFVLEDGILETQENYTDYYNGQDQLINFEHNHVLRHSLTAVTGDIIPSNQVVKGTIYSSNFSFVVPSNISNSANVSFVAIVTNEDKSVINARIIEINNSNTFEEL